MNSLLMLASSRNTRICGRIHPVSLIRVQSQNEGTEISLIGRADINRNGRSLMRLVDESRCNELGDLWEANPEQYPYYTAFVEGFVYSQYYAAIEHNKPLDRNAQADFEQLAYLTWSDIVVSDDETFFRSAFDVIWKPRGKVLESAAGFAARLQNIVAR